MGVLDNIIKYDLIGSRSDDGTTNYETINASGSTDKVDIGGVEQSFMCAITYANGSTPDVDFDLEVSDDGISYVPVDTSVTITDNSGEIIYDITGSAASFARVSYTVNSGSLDIYVRLTGKRRH